MKKNTSKTKKQTRKVGPKAEGWEGIFRLLLGHRPRGQALRGLRAGPAGGVRESVAAADEGRGFGAVSGKDRAEPRSDRSRRAIAMGGGSDRAVRAPGIRIQHTEGRLHPPK